MDFPFWMRGWTTPDYSPGDGMMYGLGSHSVDQALLLFGKPNKVTGFYRSLRGVKSKTDDTFLMVLQYDGKGEDDGGLWVEISTSCVAAMEYPMKLFVRGYEGSFVKFGDDVQEAQVGRGMKATENGFGEEPEATYGLLTTKNKFHEEQSLDERNGRYVGKYPSIKGEYTRFYTDLVAAIRGEQELYVKPEQSRDGIRVIELARESADKGVTLDWS